MSNEIQTQEIKAPLAKLRPGPWQNRTYFDPARMAELVESIRQNGIINPPLVMANNGHYELIAGERRWRASCALMLATFADIDPETAIEMVCEKDAPAIIAGQPVLKQMTFTVRLASTQDAQRLHLAAVIDNGQRESLNPVEEARDYLALKTGYGWSNHKIAQEVGKNDLYISTHLKLLELEPEIQELIAKGKLSKDRRAVEALLEIPDSPARVKLARYLAKERASIKAVQVAAQKTATLFRRGGAALPDSAPPAQKVTVAEATVAARPLQVRHGSSVCFCPLCAELVRHLAEELCHDCREGKLGEDCLKCDGFIEFAGRLLAYARPERGG